MPSTYDYYSSKVASDNESILRLVDANKVMGSVKTTICSEKEFKNRNMGRSPPAGAFYDDQNHEITVIGDAFPYPELWLKLAHEKGHHFEYPRNPWSKWMEIGTIAAELDKGHLSFCMPPKDGALSRPSTMDYLNYIEDALVNYIETFNRHMEGDDEYNGWYGKVERTMFESVLLEDDISKTVPMNGFIQFHHRLMTALSWFYLGVDGPAPSSEDGLRVGIEPYRSLCETVCINNECGLKFSTWNFKCPECGTWNNTLEDTPKIGLVTDPRSPLVSQSKDGIVSEQYAVLCEFFMLVTKHDWARWTSATSKDDVFYDKYYRKLANCYVRLAKLGCKSTGPGLDKPRFYNLGMIPSECHGKKIDLAPVVRKGFEHGRAVRETDRRWKMYRTTDFQDLKKSIGGLSIDKILPNPFIEILGVYNVTKYESLGGWETKDLDARIVRKFWEFLNGAIREGWDQSRFDIEFISYLSTMTSEEVPRALTIMNSRSALLPKTISFQKTIERLGLTLGNVGD